ncbi:MAG: ATPase [Bacteroidales bacterium]|nr:ATPase [Bacteroidales bacterium]
MILVADGGSSKTDWALVEGKGVKSLFSTMGMNPYNVSEETMKKEIEENIIPHVDIKNIYEIYIYASGCSAKVMQDVVKSWFEPYFPYAKICVEGDLLGAARATCGRAAAIAAILGTGSNSCLYDGENIIENVASLGYVLCDEGAGTNIGKLILRDYLRGRMPEDMAKKFAEIYKGDESYFLNKLYKEERPNYYLASFARFAIENKSNPYCKQVIMQAFDSFFKEQITFYTSYNKYMINVVGSIACLATEELKEVAEKYGMKINNVVKAPLKALVDYHVQ